MVIPAFPPLSFPNQKNNKENVVDERSQYLFKNSPTLKSKRRLTRDNNRCVGGIFLSDNRIDVDVLTIYDAFISGLRQEEEAKIDSRNDIYLTVKKGHKKRSRKETNRKRIT